MYFIEQHYDAGYMLLEVHEGFRKQGKIDGLFRSTTNDMTELSWYREGELHGKQILKDFESDTCTKVINQNNEQISEYTGTDLTQPFDNVDDQPKMGIQQPELEKDENEETKDNNEENSQDT